MLCQALGPHTRIKTCCLFQEKQARKPSLRYGQVLGFSRAQVLRALRDAYQTVRRGVGVPTRQGVRQGRAKVGCVSLFGGCALEQRGHVFGREAKDAGEGHVGHGSPGLFLPARKLYFPFEGDRERGTGVTWGGLSHSDLHFPEITQVWGSCGRKGGVKAGLGGLGEGTKTLSALCQECCQVLGLHSALLTAAGGGLSVSAIRKGSLGQVLTSSKPPSAE